MVTQNQKSKYTLKQWWLTVYPLFFSIYPVLTFYINNRSQLRPQFLIRPLFILPSAILLLLTIFGNILHDWHRAAFLTFLITMLVLYYGVIRIVVGNSLMGDYRLLPHWILLPFLSFILFILGNRRLWCRITTPKIISQLLSVIGFTAIVLTLGRFVITLPSNRLVIAGARVVDLNISNDMTDVNDPLYLPDIYYLIFDGHARTDILAELYDYDNSIFTQSLQQRGFFIAEESYTNYMQTALSLSSSLNMSYLDLPTDTADRNLLARMIKDSYLRTFLENYGYQFVAFSSGYDYTELRNVDIYYNPFPNQVDLNHLEGMLMDTSLGVVLTDYNIITRPDGYKRHRDTVIYPFNHIAEAARLPGPKFVFAHIMAPHPPFIFNEDGLPVQPDRPYYNADGDAYKGTREEYLTNYSKELSYIDKRIIGMVDDIIDNSLDKPVIILQADHGPGAYLNWKQYDESCVQERMAILNAYYLPGVNEDVLYPSISPVNTFRIVLNEYFETQLELLDDRYYFSYWESPYNFIDVTELVQQKCQLP